MCDSHGDTCLVLQLHTRKQTKGRRVCELAIAVLAVGMRFNLSYGPVMKVEERSKSCGDVGRKGPSGSQFPLPRKRNRKCYRVLSQYGALLEACEMPTEGQGHTTASAGHVLDMVPV